MILVTGASGFLGRHLLEVLSLKGTPVRALYFHQQSLPQFPNVEWVKCDLTDIVDLEEKMENVSLIYNCAATVSFDPKDKYRLIRENVTIVENIVNAALDAHIGKMVHVSSVAALGRDKRTPKDYLITENNQFVEGGSNSRYAFGKYLSEMEVWRGIAEGMNAVIVNPAIILGSGDWSKGSAKLMQICYDEFPWFTNGMTAWVGVDDIVQAMILLMESDISGERFILSEGNYAYKDIFTKMAQSLNKRPPHKETNKWMTEMVWRFSLLKSRLYGTQATITKETARAAQQSYLYDNSKFLKRFPQFRYTPIESVIHKMAETFLSQK